MGIAFDPLQKVYKIDYTFKGWVSASERFSGCYIVIVAFLLFHTVWWIFTLVILCYRNFLYTFYVSFFSWAFGIDSEHVTESLLLTLSGVSAFVSHIDLIFTPR